MCKDFKMTDHNDYEETSEISKILKESHRGIRDFTVIPRIFQGLHRNAGITGILKVS